MSTQNQKTEEEISWSELSADIEAANLANKFKQKLNKQPPQAWLKKNPMASGALYLPIDKVETLLDVIFQEWKVEVKDREVMLNSMVVTIRLHYKNPTTKEWSYHDGCGASPIQIDSQTSFELKNVKSSALQMAYPAAKSYAIKDAAEHLGKLFGRDVNRKGVAEYFSVYSNPTVVPKKDKEEERLILLLTGCKSLEQLKTLKNRCITEELKEIYSNIEKSLTK